MTDRRTFRMQVLVGLGADPGSAEELLSYNRNSFETTEVTQYPLPDEPFVRVWKDYCDQVQQASNISVLAKYLVQLRFPVRTGMSESADYLAATRRGVNPDHLVAATGLVLECPEQCRLVLHATAAGRLPLIMPHTREDFVLLVQALTKRNEPVHVPPSMGASMVAGYNNWHRIQLLRSVFEASHPDTGSWDVEFHKLKEQKDCYQDRFSILSNGPYSGVDASTLELQEEEWRSMSLAIRREHECAHYFTRRVFGSMRNSLMHELIADYWALRSCLGYFRADWFLRFFGLEDFPHYREGGRLQNYRGEPALSDAAFVILQRLVNYAAGNLSRFDERCSSALQQPEAQPALFLALSAQTVEEIASEDGAYLLSDSFLHAMQTVRQGSALQSVPAFNQEQGA